MRKIVLKLLPLICLALFFAVLFVGVKNQSQAWYFQDENEHVAIGWVLAHFPRQLYNTISTNHQPLPIAVGAVFANTIPYGTFFEFIDRLRVGMLLFAFLPAVGIVLRFRWRGLLSVMAVYSLGHYYFAWQVLAESLAVPAILWMFLAVLDDRQSKIDSVVFGLAAFWASFTLLPLWPFVLISSLYYFWKGSTKNRVLLIASFGLPTVTLFACVDPRLWWRETVINNLLYFIPFEGGHDRWHYLRILLYPVFHLPLTKSILAQHYQTFLMLAGTALVMSFQTLRTHKKILVRVAVAMLLLLSLNVRISDIDVVYYRGFHLLPYLAGVAVVMSALFFQVFQNWYSSAKLRMFAISGGTLLVFLLMINNMSWVWEKRQKLNDYYISYDTYSVFGNALKTLRQPGDTLMTGSDGSGYINMLSGIPLAGRQNFHLEWAYRVPYLREAWLDMIQHAPPTFLYYNLNGDSYSRILEPLVLRDYVTLRRRGGAPTQMRMRKDAVNTVTPAQWQKFEDQAFEKPAEAKESLQK